MVFVVVVIILVVLFIIAVVVGDGSVMADIRLFAINWLVIIIFTLVEVKRVKALNVV